MDIFTVINDEGETEELDINGYKFSNLPECFQNAIKEYSFVICYTDNADQEEQADTFYNLNNGQSLNAATMNRVKAKSKEQISRLAKHKLLLWIYYKSNWISREVYGIIRKEWRIAGMTKGDKCWIMEGL